MVRTDRMIDRPQNQNSRLMFDIMKTSTCYYARQPPLSFAHHIHAFASSYREARQFNVLGLDAESTAP